MKKGTKLLILGGGANALAHAENAHNMGAYICQTIDMARADVFKKAGVDFLIDFRAENLVEELKKACPEGFDILIDGVGYASSVNQVLPLMKPNFTVGVYEMCIRDRLHGSAAEPPAGRFPLHLQWWEEP